MLSFPRPLEGLLGVSEINLPPTLTRNEGLGQTSDLSFVKNERNRVLVPGNDIAALFSYCIREGVHQQRPGYPYNPHSE